MSTTTEEMQMLSFNIILHAGNARSHAMEAIALAKEYKFVEANKKIEKAEEEFNKAHHIQTDLLQKEANGEKNNITVILIHAQDHLMTAMTVKDLALEMIDMYKKMEAIDEANQ